LRLSLFLHPCFYFYARAGPSLPFFGAVETGRSTVSDPFESDVGLDCVCDEVGLGFDWGYAHALTD
jgi:hypothetical protein